jgi:integrase
MTLVDILERYAVLMNLSPRSVVLYRHSIEKLRQFVGHEPTTADLDDFTIARFLRWRATNTRGKKPISPESVAKDRSQILALWNWSCRKKLHTGEWPALARQKRIHRTPRAYTATDVARIITHAKRRHGTTGGLPSAWWWSSIIYAAWCCGARIGELMQLRWQHLDLERGRVLFVASTRKGGAADISHALPPDLCRQLAEHRGSPDDLVWPWDRQPTSIYPSMRLLCRAAGVPYRAFHAIRKASASYVAAGGGDATAHLGHSDPAMTRGHYLDPSITQTRSALDYLPPLDLADEAEFVPDPEERS